MTHARRAPDRASLPTPALVTPRYPIDPYRERQAYARMLSALYHAEEAAMDGFRHLTDTSLVQPHPMFARASRKLIADESRHLEDVRAIVRMLGVSDVLPASTSEREFWVAWRSGRTFALPLKASVASLFCLFSEGLGYAVLYHLAEATTDPEIRALLRQNVEDEKMHLQLSIAVLRNAVAANPDGFLQDFLVYSFGWFVMAKRGIREHRHLFEDLGFDFGEVFASSIAFVGELLRLVSIEQPSRAWDVVHALFRLGGRRRAAEAVYLAMHLPTPELVHRWIRRRGERALARVPSIPAEPLREVA